MRRVACIVCGVLFAYLSYAQTKVVSVPKISCIASNHDYVVIMHNADGTVGEPQVKDDWYVNCTITVDGKVIYDKPLRTLHPLDWPDASAAINEFRTKTAQEILGKKEKK